MTKHEDPTDATTGHTDREGDGTLGPGTTAGGGAVRAGERVDNEPAGERDPDAEHDLRERR